MNFNHPDRTKETQEIIFSCKAKEIYHPPLVLNNTSVSQSSSPKNLGGILDSTSILDEHLKNGIFKNKQNPWTSPKIEEPATKIRTNYHI